MKKRIHETIVEEKSKSGAPCWAVYDQYFHKPEICLTTVNDGTLLIFQQNKKNAHDVLEMTVGQAYDLLQVVSRALSIPVKGF